MLTLALGFKKYKELEPELDNAYKPGFGILMGNIQTHHFKLWF